MSVLYPDTDKAENLLFKPIRKLPTGSLRVDLRYKKGNNEIDILYQTPRVGRVFAKNWAKEDTGSANWKLSLSMSGYSTPGTETYDFLEGWKEVEATVHNTAVASCQEWFKASFRSRDGFVYVSVR